MAKFRERWTVGRITSKLAPVGTSDWRGLANMASGTVITSIAATGVVSGAVIQVTPYMYTGAMTSPSIALHVASVSAGAFIVVAANSNSPTANMPFVWSVIR